MAEFWGRYEDLPTLEAAKQSLLDIEHHLEVEKLGKVMNEALPVAERYDSLRYERMIEGLQMVVIRNGGNLGFSRLPVFYKPRDKHGKT